mgnify:CR=1 FL=1
MSLLRLATRLPAYWAFRRFGRPRRLPLSLVVSVCYRCNSRCSTCNVWKRQAQELTLDEWTRVFRKLGRAPYYMTFSGGEPFLREDLAEIVAAACRLCRPAVVTIPTNGLLPARIQAGVEAILAAAPETQIGINLSLDGVGEQHDQIRNVPGNWERALETYRALRALKRPNLTLSIHTVISTLNVADVPRIYQGLMALEPDSYITEIAEERGELGTIGMCITPAAEQYAAAADFLIDQLRRRPFRGFARVTQAFRSQYYALVKRILAEERQVIPCYAGWASGHIAPDGDVWTCCIRAEPIGNLRETDYDLAPIWFGQAAERLRRSIRAGECACPMANAAYANMLLHPPTLARVLRELAAGWAASPWTHPKESP